MLRLLLTTTVTSVMASFLMACSHPTDQKLLDEFQRHRPELEQLISMFQADKGLGRVGNSFTSPEDPREVGVSPERIAQYRKLCNTVGAKDCIEGYDAAYYGATRSGRSEEKDPIWIHVSSQGLAISGSSKGYYYSAAPAEEIVASLDGVASTHSRTWLRHIEGKWYLYYDVED